MERKKALGVGDKDSSQAARVSRFMMELSQKNRERWLACAKKPGGCGPPFGDLAYGTALMRWYQDGCPKAACFSYAEGQVACPYLLEFREEITAEFKLPILTVDEAKEFDKTHRRIITTNVHDWGSN